MADEDLRTKTAAAIDAAMARRPQARRHLERLHRMLEDPEGRAVLVERLRRWLRSEPSR